MIIALPLISQPKKTFVVAGIYKSEIRQQRNISLQRECYNCGHKWFFELQIEAKGEGTNVFNVEGARHNAIEDAQKKLDKEEKWKKDDIKVGVLCPKCGHFDKNARDKYFKKGYVDFLLSRFKKEKSSSLRWGISLAILATFLLGYVIVRLANTYFTPDYTKGDVSWFLMIVCFMISVLFIIASLANMKRFNIARRSHHDVIKKIGEYTEEQALQSVIKCYHKNKDSLDRGDAWVDVLIKES